MLTTLILALAWPTVVIVIAVVLRREMRRAALDSSWDQVSRQVRRDAARGVSWPGPRP